MSLWPYRTPEGFFLPSRSKMGMPGCLGPVVVLWLGERHRQEPGKASSLLGVPV